MFMEMYDIIIYYIRTSCVSNEKPTSTTPTGKSQLQPRPLGEVPFMMQLKNSRQDVLTQERLDVQREGQHSSRSLDVSRADRRLCVCHISFLGHMIRQRSDSSCQH